jgi:hypothetical protein
MNLPITSIRHNNYFFLSVVIKLVHFRDLGEIFHLSLFCLWYKSDCLADGAMRSSPITALTTWFMSVRSTLSSFTTGFPKYHFAFGVLSLFTPSVNCFKVSLSRMSVLQGSLSLPYPKRNCEIFHTLLASKWLSNVAWKWVWIKLGYDFLKCQIFPSWIHGNYKPNWNFDTGKGLIFVLPCYLGRKDRRS